MPVPARRADPTGSRPRPSTLRYAAGVPGPIPSLPAAPGPLAGRERAAFERDGFVVLPGALDEDTVGRLRAQAARLDAAFRARPGINRHAVLNRHDLIGLDEVFLELVDWPATFPKVVDLLGWNIQLFHTQLVVTPPAHPQAPAGAYAWHQDNNRMNRELGPAPHPMISVKVAYFLSDCAEPGMGNLCVHPGSQFAPEPPPGPGVEICARAGDALLFDRRLWHAASTNHSPVTRIVCFYGYSYRWLRTKSRFPIQVTTDPIRRQLLGWARSANGHFDPAPEEVPLRAWVEEHLGPGAASP